MDRTDQDRATGTVATVAPLLVGIGACGLWGGRWAPVLFAAGWTVCGFSLWLFCRSA